MDRKRLTELASLMSRRRIDRRTAELVGTFADDH